MNCLYFDSKLHKDVLLIYTTGKSGNIRIIWHLKDCSTVHWLFIYMKSGVKHILLLYCCLKVTASLWSECCFSTHPYCLALASHSTKSLALILSRYRVKSLVNVPSECLLKFWMMFCPFSTWYDCHLRKTVLMRESSLIYSKFQY